MTDEVLVYATLTRADLVRRLLAAACAASGVSARLELYGSGSLFQRLGPRHAPPLPDITFWTGPFAGQAAADAGLLQPYQPAGVAEAAVHDAQWRWTAVDSFVFGVEGSPPTSNFDELGNVPLLALPDPERSEIGTMLLLGTLDRARQLQGDPEQGWAWWQRRVQAGIRLFEDEAAAHAAIGGGPSHAVGTLGNPPGVVGLAPMPNAIGLATNARNVEAARRLLDWLCGQEAAALLPLSPWRASASGLLAALQAAPPLDVQWGTQQYSAARRRWAQSGFGPTPP